MTGSLCITGAAEEPGAAASLGVVAGDRDLDRQLPVEQAAVAVELFHVDDGRNDAPEIRVPVASFDENREPADEALAALHQIHRAGQDEVAGIAGPYGRVALRSLVR